VSVVGQLPLETLLKIGLHLRGQIAATGMLDEPLPESMKEQLRRLDRATDKRTLCDCTQRWGCKLPTMDDLANRMLICRERAKRWGDKP
jgi:hypothetical protein